MSRLDSVNPSALETRSVTGLPIGAISAVPLSGVKLPMPSITPPLPSHVIAASFPPTAAHVTFIDSPWVMDVRSAIKVMMVGMPLIGSGVTGLPLVSRRWCRIRRDSRLGSSRPRRAGTLGAYTLGKVSGPLVWASPWAGCRSVSRRWCRIRRDSRQDSSRPRQPRTRVVCRPVGVSRSPSSWRTAQSVLMGFPGRVRCWARQVAGQRDQEQQDCGENQCLAHR